MWFSWNDFDRQLSPFGDIFRQLDRQSRRSPEAQQAVDRESYILTEGPENYEFKIDLPGVAQDALEIDVHDQTLTLSARREIVQPEGMAMLRGERRAFAWKRSVNLPGKVNADRVSARFDDGVLTVSLGRAEELQPRRIKIATTD